MSDSDVAASLIAALGREGEHIDDGRFSLDSHAARAKLRAFALHEPLAYVLLVVEAAHVASQASGKVVFDISRTTTASFDGPALTDAQLRDPFSSLFLASEDLDADELAAVRVVQLLGLAANAALGARVNFVEIEQADASGRNRAVRITEDEVSPLVERGQSVPGRTVFRAEGRALDGARAAMERALLEHRCELASMAIVVDGERVDAGPGAAFAGFRRVQTTAIGLDEHGIVGQAARMDITEPAKLLLLTRSVLAETIMLPACRPGFVAVVELDLRKDLSQAKVVRDASFDALLQALVRADERLPWASEVKVAPAKDEAAFIPILLVLLLVLPIVFIVVLTLARG